jgi:hypothetical protein
MITKTKMNKTHYYEGSRRCDATVVWDGRGPLTSMRGWERRNINTLEPIPTNKGELISKASLTGKALAFSSPWKDSVLYREKRKKRLKKKAA